MSRNLTWVRYNGRSKPKYQTEGSAGCDLHSDVDAIVPAGSWVSLPTGLSLELPSGFMAMVCPRSGLAASAGVTVLNAPGIIDNDYRGEVRVLLINHSRSDYYVKMGDRIAQLIFTPAFQANLVEGDVAPDTARGTGGFGSTGK